MSALKFLLRTTTLKDVSRTYNSYCQLKRFQRFSSKPDKEEMTRASPLKNLLDEATSYEDANPTNPNNVWATLPYPVVLRDQLERQNAVLPEDMSIILFPGQGTQYMGMGKDLLKFPKARNLFELANEILGVNLPAITKPQDLLKYSQELVVVCSLAAVERLREERPSALISCVATAGFSLGEITALIFAGAIPVEDGLRLVSVRAAAMEAASKLKPGGMLTVIYTPAANIGRICEQARQHCLDLGDQEPFCTVANYLYPSCKVISGCEGALQYIEQNASSLGIRMTKRLKVSGAFHSEGVAAAVHPFREALNLCHLEPTKIKVISSVTAKHYHGVNEIRAILPKQIVRPVRWEQLLHNIYERPGNMKFPRTFEVGPGQTLRTILRKVNAKAWDNSISILA